MSKEDIENDLMELFEQSIGKNVRVKGTPLVDEITHVNWQLMTVGTKNYGEFGVYLCELTNEENAAQTN